MFNWLKKLMSKDVPPIEMVEQNYPTCTSCRHCCFEGNVFNPKYMCHNPKFIKEIPNEMALINDREPKTRLASIFLDSPILPCSMLRFNEELVTKFDSNSICRFRSETCGKSGRFFEPKVEGEI